MIHLGTLSLNNDARVAEARMKILQVCTGLTGDTVTATRLATAASQMSRSLVLESNRPSIAVDLSEEMEGPTFVLTFFAQDSLPAANLLNVFFDSTYSIFAGDGVNGIRAVKIMRGQVLPTAEEIERLRNIVEVKSRDELMGELQVKNRELKEAFENLKRTTLAKQRMEGELKVAHEIQMSMLPLVFPPFPDRKEFTIFANLIPAREVGGDLYDFFFIDDDHLCITVGDVSGKGVPAALFMARTKTLLKSSATNDLSPASIVTHANEELSENNDSSMFVTLFLGILKVKTGHFAYTNAGHNPSYIKRPADGAVTRLDTLHGPVLGAMEGMTYQQDQLLLRPGDTLLMYTDGVTEAMDPDDNLYSEERLAAWFTAREDTTVEELVQDVADDVKKFENGAVQADDITLMAINFNGRD